MIKLPSPLKSIILDMDGVLADTEPIHIDSFRIMLKEYGIIATDKFLQSLTGHSVESNIEDINTKFMSNQPLDIKKTALYRDKIYLNLLEKSDLKPNPGIENLIHYCVSNKIILALASSSIREQIDMILSKLSQHSNASFSYNNIFSAIVSGEDVLHKKPARDIYQMALKKLGATAEESFAIEDSRAGVQSAQANGLLCIALNNEYTPKSDLAIANWQVDSIEEIVTCLAKFVNT